MKKFFTPLIFLALSVAMCHAQASYSNLSATVTDPNGNPYANAYYTIVLVDVNGNIVSSPTTPNGSIFAAKTITGELDENGYFSVPLVKNSILTKPGGTKWKINISAPSESYILSYAPSWSIEYLVSVTGNVDLSSQLSSLAREVAFMNLKTNKSTMGLGCGTLIPCILANGSTATTQAQGDNSNKVATTSYADTVLNTAEAGISDKVSLSQTGMQTLAGNLNAKQSTANAGPSSSGALYPNWAAAKSRQVYVWEDYLSSADGHGGTDYGYAFANFCAVENCAAFTSPVTLRATATGAHKVYTTINNHYSVTLDGSNASFVPQSGGAGGVWGSSSISATATSVTLMGSVENGSCPGWVVPVSSATGLSVGMKIAGLGILPETYIAAISGTNLTVSQCPQVSITGWATTGSSVLHGIAQLGRLAVGNSLILAPPFAVSGNTTVTINSIDLTTGSVTVSAAATGQGGLVTGVESGSLAGVTLTAQSVAPVIKVGDDTDGGCLMNEFNQCIGVGVQNLHIDSTRSLIGVEGIQVCGVDDLRISNVQENLIAGTGFLAGGYGCTSTHINQVMREAYIDGLRTRNSGDYATGQASWAYADPFAATSGAYGDSNNTNMVVNSQSTDFYGPGLYIGTGKGYPGVTAQGPRLNTFSNVQIEGGLYVPESDGGVNWNAPVPAVWLNQAGNTSFVGGFYNGVGFAQSIFEVDNGYGVDVKGSTIQVGGGIASLSVTVTGTNGSPTISCATACFNTKYMAGSAITVGSGVYYIKSVESPTSATLQSNFAGTTGSNSATIWSGGYMLSTGSSLHGTDYNESDVIRARAVYPSASFYTAIGVGSTNFQYATVAAGGAVQTRIEYNGTEYTYDNSGVPVDGYAQNGEHFTNSTINTNQTRLSPVYGGANGYLGGVSGNLKWDVLNSVWTTENVGSNGGWGVFGNSSGSLYLCAIANTGTTPQTITQANLAQNCFLYTVAGTSNLHFAKSGTNATFVVDALTAGYAAVNSYCSGGASCWLQGKQTDGTYYLFDPFTGTASMQSDTSGDWWLGELGKQVTIRGTYKQYNAGYIPTVNAGTIGGYSSANGGAVTGLSAVSSVTVTFASGSFSNAAYCTVSSNVSGNQPYVSSTIGAKAAVTFSFPTSFTGSITYHCDGY